MNLISATSGGQNEKASLLAIANFLQDIMASSSSYCGKSKTQPDPAGQIINSTWKKFSRETFKILNKKTYILFQLKIK